MGKHFSFKQEYDASKENNPYLMSQLLGFSKYWILVLYEVLRKFREVQSEGKKPLSFSQPFDKLDNVFREVELVRMPLAKYEVAKERDGLAWPEFDFYLDTGSCGWKVFCKKSGELKAISRHKISEEFLSISEEILKLQKEKQ